MARLFSFVPQGLLPDRLQQWTDVEYSALRAERTVIAFQILSTNAETAMSQLLCLANDSADEKRAIHATRAMYGMGPQSVSAFLQIIQNTNAPGRYQALLGLEGHGTNSLPAVPILINCLKDPADDVAGGAAEMLGRLRLKPDESIPALIRCLNGDAGNPNADASAARSLGQFGANALSAVPALLAALTNKNDYLRRVAKEALLHIDPDILTNAPAK